MRWLTGGLSTIVACAVVIGCGDVPEERTSPRADSTGSAESVAPGHASGEAVGEPAQEPGTRPAPPVPPRQTDQPGVPGSPITYDVTNLQGLHPERVKRVIGERLAAELPPHCRADLCGIEFVFSVQDDGKCFRSASPGTVYPGDTITLFVGTECDQPERDEPVPEESTSEEPAPEEPGPEEPGPEEPAGPTTARTGSGG
ncbi:hypothetical protein ACQPYE_20710 [Actinosynnema sp. CA-299493]